MAVYIATINASIEEATTENVLLWSNHFLGKVTMEVSNSKLLLSLRENPSGLDSGAKRPTSLEYPQARSHKTGRIIYFVLRNA